MIMLIVVTRYSLKKNKEKKEQGSSVEDINTEPEHDLRQSLNHSRDRRLSSEAYNVSGRDVSIETGFRPD